MVKNGQRMVKSELTMVRVLTDYGKSIDSVW